MKEYFSKTTKICLLCCIFAFLLTTYPVCAAAKSSETVSGVSKSEVKKGLVKEGKTYAYYVNGECLKSTWKTIKDKSTGKKYRYYFRENGKAIVARSARLRGKVYVFDSKGRLIQKGKNTRVTLNGKTYYVDKNGQAITGWIQIKNKLYLADSMGRFYKQRTFGDISFDHETGEINQDAAGSLKLRTRSIVSSITNSRMSKSQKLRACWNYVTHTGGFYYSPVYPDLNQQGWQKNLALRMLTNKRGNCYGFACAFAALAQEIGYSPKVVCGRVTGTRDGAADGLTRHCWVMIHGCYYDPEAEWKGWMKGIYGTSYYPITYKVQKEVKF